MSQFIVMLKIWVKLLLIDVNPILLVSSFKIKPQNKLGLIKHSQGEIVCN